MITHRYLHYVILAVLTLFLTLTLHEGGTAQQNSPFGVSAPPAPAPVGGNFLREKLSWIYQQQAIFYKSLTGAVKEAKANSNAAIFLVGLSFLYGIFHAAGPGHGKIVVSSYVLANEQSTKRGILISFLAALLQGCVAVFFIGLAVFAFNLTSFAITDATFWFERASYALIAALGLFLLWQKGLRVVLVRKTDTHAANATIVHKPTCHQHKMPLRTPDQHNCGCSGHAVDPLTMKAPLSLRSAWAAIISVGLRPCSGALIVLVFAAAQGVFLIGVASTFAMAVGTGITVATLATVALCAKGLATRYLSTSGSVGWFFKSVELFGASLVFLLGATLLAASFHAG